MHVERPCQIFRRARGPHPCRSLLVEVAYLARRDRVPIASALFEHEAKLPPRTNQQRAVLAIAGSERVDPFGDRIEMLVSVVE